MPSDDLDRLSVGDLVQRLGLGRDADIAQAIARQYAEAATQLRKLNDHIQRIHPCGLCEGSGVLEAEMRLCVRCGGKGWNFNAHTVAQIAEQARQDVELAFTEGMRAAETVSGSCPHPPDSSGHHWWTRGFSYAARLLRAHDAERDRGDLREGIRRYRRVLSPQLRLIGQTEVGARLDADEWERDHAPRFPQE